MKLIKSFLVVPIVVVMLSISTSAMAINQATKDLFNALNSQPINIENVKKLAEVPGVDVNAKNEKGQTPLWFALLGSKDVVKLLLDKGAKVDARSFVFAANLGDKEIFEMLLNAGAKIDEKSDLGGLNALMNAAQWGKKEIVEILLAKGADVNLKESRGMTALGLAEWQGHKEIIELLKNFNNKQQPAKAHGNVSSSSQTGSKVSLKK